MKIYLILLATLILGNAIALGQGRNGQKKDKKKDESALEGWSQAPAKNDALLERVNRILTLPQERNQTQPAEGSIKLEIRTVTPSQTQLHSDL